MAHVKPFLIVGIDAFGDVGIAGWGQGEHEEEAKMNELRKLYPESAWLTAIMLDSEDGLRSLRTLQKEGAKRNDPAATNTEEEEG